VVFTGTHDNDTTVGWFRDTGGTEALRSQAQADEERRGAMDYLVSDGKEIHWDMIRMALMSVAATAIIPAQDLLGLGSEARMNRPATASGNWTWRLREGALDGDVAARLLHLTRTYGRAPAAAESVSP
jgi:4-alpha-glucanotransferase